MLSEMLLQHIIIIIVEISTCFIYNLIWLI